jgi:DNA repair protein RecN (Recombination protein N)
MLLELKVSHFAVIDSLQVNFLRPGLNVLTGETGAGKSILLKSLSLLLGGKTGSDVIRAGHEQAVIEGAFDLSKRPDVRGELEEMALGSGEDVLVVRRIISQGGRNRLYINGNLSTLNVLENIVGKLVEITGQHEHHSLIRPSSQLEVLDDYASLKPLRSKFLDNYNEARRIREEIEKIASATRDREQRLDFLRFQINEIDAFNPVAGEEADLNARYQRARFSNKLHSFAEKAESVLYSEESSVHARLADLAREGEALIELDPKLREGVQNLKEASVLVEDAAFSFRDYAKMGRPDENEMEILEDRLSQLKKLQRKYGASTEEIIAFKNQAKAEFDAIEKSEENIKDLQALIKKIESEMDAQARELHQKRKKYAKVLTEGINDELHDLNMKGVEFSINVNEIPDLTTTGRDEVLFMIKPSPKDDFRPISKIASGGELSRLMLAIKQVVSASDLPMTYLFDEVDSGVSGPTAEKVGRKLKSIGKIHQVISITHLPQVAAAAHAHFLITKEVNKGYVKSEVMELKLKDRVQELGRMISGEKITASSLAHAKEMLQQAH